MSKRTIGQMRERVLRQAITWANSEPVLRSLTNGNIEGRPPAEIKLARYARELWRAESVSNEERR